MSRHDEIWGQLTGYALGELSAPVREQVQAHLAGCAECAIEVRELSLALEAVGVSSTPMTPPVSVKDRMLAGLGSQPFPQALPTTPTTLTIASGRISRPWLAIAASTVLVVGGILAVSQQRAAGLAAELRRVDANVAQLATEATTVAAQADLAVAILTASDMRRIDLQGFDASRDAAARAYWSGTKGLLIVADRLPPPPPGRIYQVWLIGTGGAGPVSAGLVRGRAGRGMLIVAPPAGVTGGTVTVAVTDEPDGGVPAPTGSKHLVGSV